MDNPFPWGWFLFWLVIFWPIAFLIVLVRAPQVIIIPLGLIAMFSLFGALLQ